MSRLLLVCVLTTALSAPFRTSAATGGSVSYKLVRQDGRACIQASDGTLIPWACYSLPGDRSVEQWAMKFPGFIRAGVHLYQIRVWPRQGASPSTNPFWSMDGEPCDPGQWNCDPGVLANTLMEMDPKARFIIRFETHPDAAWRDSHKSEFAALDNLPPERSARLSSTPSLASDAYVRGVDRLVRDVVRWCEARPWRNRIVGYTVFPAGEGVTEAAIEGMLFEQSLPMQKAFCAFISGKYKTNAVLQAAWRDQQVTLSTVRVPTDAEWRVKRAALMHWPEPVETRRERDYFEFQCQLFGRFFDTIFTALAEATRDRPVLKGGDLLKQPMQGWIIQPEFMGTWNRGTAYEFPHILLATGSVCAERLLDQPGLDILQTPGIYFNRAMGYAWEAEGVSDSLALRGKVNFMEADMRTWVGRDAAGKPSPAEVSPDFGAFRTPAEMRAGFDRTLAWAVSRNQMFYWMSVSGSNWWYDDPVIREHIARQRAAIEALAKTPWTETRDAICMVIDDQAAIHEDFTAGFQHLAVFRQLQEGLALCGIPYRLHLLRDLGRKDFPDYKVWLFPNLFRVDAEVLALLKGKVLRNGNLAIFGPGTGVTDGETRSAVGASKLLGVPMELVVKTVPRRVLIGGDHPILTRLQAATFGEDYAYGPLLVPTAQRFEPAAPGARTLGSGWFFYGLDRPGLFINEFGAGAAGNGRTGERGEGDCAVVFSAAVPLPPDLLRECARYAGCNVWSEANAVVYANQSFVALHVAKAGRYVINLPRPCRVTDFYTHTEIAAKATQFAIDLQAPETRIFTLE